MRNRFVIALLLGLTLVPIPSASAQFYKQASTGARLERKENNQERILQKRAENRGKLEARREQLQEKLAQLSDERKSRLAENINNALSRLNERWTDHFGDVLDKLTEILDKIEARVQTLKANGTDTVLADSAIATARTAITTAESAVTEQAGKDYTIEISEEATLREDITMTKNQLKADLRAVHELIKTAREAVRAVIQTLH